MGSIVAMLVLAAFPLVQVHAQVDNSALIAQLKAQIATLVAQLQTLQAQQGGTAWCYTFNTNMGVGSQNDAVTNLMRALTREKLMAAEIDLQTQRAGAVFDEGLASTVVSFQQKYGIPATGFVGPLTRAKLNQLYGCGISVSPVMPTARVYENQYMSLKVPDDWHLTEATRTSTDQTYNKATGITTVNGTRVEKTGAVNIMKGNYILYINPNASQAGGAEGGRFAEIAMGAPSVDAVMTDQPNPPCGAGENVQTTLGTRADYYVSGATMQSYCNAPANGDAVWYFSYITKSGGYFNYYNSAQPMAWVITMAYKGSNVNQLPRKGSPE